jgi:RHS repeat-associated protein
VVDTTYAPCGCSPLGKLTQSSRPHTVGGTQYWTVNTYDASGRTTRVTLPDGSHTDYAYQGNTVTVTDPAGKWKKFTLDALGNLTIVQEPDPTFGTVSTNYTYDILNHLTNVSMPRGANTQTRTFVYNTGATVGAFLLSATNPETGTVTYTYSNGLLASKTDAKGQQLTYQYDTYHRLTSVTWTNSPNGSQVLRTYYYDSNPLAPGFSQYAAGRLAAVQYASTGTNLNGVNQISLIDMYSYTQAGLPAIKRLQVNEAMTWQYGGFGQSGTGSANFDVSYQYNNEGKVTSVTYPTSGSGAGATYNYTYDSMSRLYSMTDGPTTPVVNSSTYGPANELLTFSFWPVGYASANETRTYNTLGQMTNLSVTYPTTTSTQYTYPTGSNNGKISSQKINASGEEVQYTYDSLNRLISGITTAASDATGNTPWGQNYSYDGFGNLTAKTVSKGSAPTMSVSVNPATNRITGVYNMIYDANGNVTSTPSPSGTSQLAYDAENRMISVVGQMNYGYDAQNKRFWSWDGSTDMYGNVTAYKIQMYSPSGQKLAMYQVDAVVGGFPPYTASLSTTLLSSDKYFGGRRIQIEDRLSSTNGKFYPYGEDKPGNPASDTWKFATYWRDSQTNLDYADQRYFSSQYGRFTSPDPYKASGGPGDPASWNQYAYTRADPINRNDPSGLADFDVTGYCYGCAGDGGAEDPRGGNGLLGGLGFSGDSSMEQLYIQPHFTGGGGNLVRTKFKSPDGNFTVSLPTGSILVNKTITALKDALPDDPDCAGWLSTIDDVRMSGGLNKWLDNLRGIAGSADFSDSGIAGASNTSLWIPGFNLLFNRNGDFFTNTGAMGLPSSYNDVRTLGANTDNGRIFLLLHELGHLLTPPGFQNGDGSGDALQKANNDLVWQHCNKTIKSF